MLGVSVLMIVLKLVLIAERLGLSQLVTATAQPMEWNSIYSTVTY